MSSVPNGLNGLSPWPAGQTYPVTFSLVLDDGSIDANLATATFTLIIHNAFSGMDVTGSGVFGAFNTTTGEIVYTWGANDPTSKPGRYQLWVETSIGRTYGPADWRVIPI